MNSWVVGRRNRAWWIVAVVTLLLLGAHTKLTAQRPGGGALLDPFMADTVMSPPSGPRIVRLPAPGSPIVALRLSVPIVEGPAEAGAARILQMLGEQRARALGTSVGAHVEGSRTPWGISYTVMGPAADLDYLTYLLRQAVRDPAGEAIDFAQARATLMAEAQRRAETPGGRVTAQLRNTAAPFAPPSGGTPGSLTRMTLAGIRDMWLRSHQPDRMTLLVSGDVQLDVLLVSMMEMGAPTSTVTGPLDAPVSEPSTPRAQVIRHWYGEARPIADSSEPYAEVAAILVADQLRANAGSFEAEVRLWELRQTKLLTVVGAAYRADRQTMRRSISGVLETTAESVRAQDVARAVAGVRAELLLGARTPLGRVNLVGRHLDATGSVGAARAYLTALDRVTLDGTKEFLRTLASTAAANAEVGP